VAARVDGGESSPIDRSHATLLHLEGNDVNVALVERLRALRPNVT
jgi:hypothetical protein